MEKRFWEVLRTSGRVWESVEAFQVLRGFGSWKQAFGGSWDLGDSARFGKDLGNMGILSEPQSCKTPKTAFSHMKQ